MNEYKDETIKCVDCGQEFVFTAGEQAFYASKGFTNKPKRCKACREKKKSCYESNETRKCIREAKTSLFFCANNANCI